MITRNEKAKGLWWRLLATLPVLAVLLIANTKVTAQEKKADDRPITIEMGQFEIYDDDGNPFQLMDTVIYNEDGSYFQCVATDGIDPKTGESCKKFKITTHNADGTPNGSIMNLRWERDGDVVQYTAEPFSITEESLETLLGGLSTLADKQDNDTLYDIVEEMPRYPGGEQAMFDFISKNVKYPEEAKDKNIAGRVFMGFVVEKDGSVSNVEVLRGIGGGCDEEAMRVVKAMPKWTPGKQDGKPVRVSFILPFTFKLDGGQTKGNGLAGTIWEGTGIGTKGKTTYTWHFIMQFTSENEGLFIEKLTTQKKNEQPKMEFDDVAMDFEYAFDGKKTGGITPKNGDGSYMNDDPANGFILSDDGKTITVNFYDMKEDCGFDKVVFTKR